MSSLTVPRDKLAQAIHRQRWGTWKMQQHRQTDFEVFLLNSKGVISLGSWVFAHFLTKGILETMHVSNESLNEPDKALHVWIFLPVYTNCRCGRKLAESLPVAWVEMCWSRNKSLSTQGKEYPRPKHQTTGFLKILLSLNNTQIKTSQ